MSRGNDALLEAAKVWKSGDSYYERTNFINIVSVYKQIGGPQGRCTGRINLRIETNEGCIDIYEFGFNGVGEFPLVSYSTHYQSVSFNAITKILTIKSKPKFNPTGKPYTVELYKQLLP